MNYDFALSCIDAVAIGVLGLMILISWYYVGSFIISWKKVKPVPHSDKKTHFGIIVAARNESKVVRHILNSLKAQTYDKNYFDVWVVVEDENDETINIARRRGFNWFVRKDIEGKRTKGYAIQELYNYFKENNINFDAYMIFDADNIISYNYLEVMNDLRQTGVQCGVGYRNYTNGSDNWITCTNAVFFSYMMTFTSRMRTELFKKFTICGTGYFIDQNIIDDAGGWIFTGMTEDTELTNYCYYHNVNMRYYPLIDYYDEQTSTIRMAHKQKIRWIFGYFSSKKRFREGNANYHANTEKIEKISKFEYNVSFFPFVIFGVVNFILLIISLILAIVSMFDGSNQYTNNLFMHVLFQFLLLFLTFVIVALLVIIKDRKKLRFNMGTIVWACLTYWLFFFDIIICIVEGLIFKKKRTDWQPIKHTGKVTVEEHARGDNSNE